MLIKVRLNFMNRKTLAIILIFLVIGVLIFFVLQGKGLSEEINKADAPHNEISEEAEGDEFYPDNDLIVEGNSDQEIRNEDVKVDTMDIFVRCLIDKGMVVYTSRTCPACSSFAQQFGGDEKVEGLFVECNREWERCAEEMKTGFVPEIQISGKLYEGSKSLKSLAMATSCEL